MYLDVVFLQNFFMDTLLLAMTGKLMRFRCKAVRIGMGGAAGAVWACAVLAVPAGMPVKFFLTCGPVSLLMVFLAFGARRPGELLRAAGGLYVTAVLMAGGLELLREFLSRLSLGGKLRLYGKGCALFLAAAAVFFFVCFLWEAVGEARRERKCLAEVSIFFQGNEVRLKAFLDTGNRLFDPVFRRPVNVVWAGALNGLFDRAEGVTFIPYRSVGREGGLLPAVKAERISIELDGEKRELKNPLLAVSKTPLSSDGTYGMLLHEAAWEQSRPLQETGRRTGKRKRKPGMKETARPPGEKGHTAKIEPGREGMEEQKEDRERETQKEAGKRKLAPGEGGNLENGRKRRQEKKEEETEGENDAEQEGAGREAGMEAGGRADCKNGGESGRAEPENQSGGEKYGD